MKEVKEYLAKFEKLLPVGTSISFTEAERRAGEFLGAMAYLANLRHLLSEDKIRCLSLQTAVYAQEMAQGTSSTVTANKIAAEASDDYTAAREQLERVENDISYLKAYTDIMTNAHIFYRTMAKGDHSL